MVVAVGGVGWWCGGVVLRFGVVVWCGVVGWLGVDWWLVGCLPAVCWWLVGCLLGWLVGCLPAVCWWLVGCLLAWLVGSHFPVASSMCFPFPSVMTHMVSLLHQTITTFTMRVPKLTARHTRMIARLLTHEVACGSELCFKRCCAIFTSHT